MKTYFRQIQQQGTGLYYWKMTQINKNGVTFEGQSRLFNSPEVCEKHMRDTIKEVKNVDYEVLIER